MQAGTSRRLLGLDAEQAGPEARRQLSLVLHPGQRRAGPGAPGTRSGRAAQGQHPSCWPALWPPHPPPALDPYFPHPLSKRAEPDNGQRAPEGSAPTFCGSEPERSRDLLETYRHQGLGRDQVLPEICKGRRAGRGPDRGPVFISGCRRPLHNGYWCWTSFSCPPVASRVPRSGALNICTAPVCPSLALKTMKTRDTILS